MGWLSCANNGKWWIITFEHTLQKPYAALWPMLPNEEWCGASMSSVQATISLILQICNRYLIQLMESMRNYSTSIWHPSILICSRLLRQPSWSDQSWITDNNISCGILTTCCITKSPAKRLAQCSLSGEFSPSEIPLNFFLWHLGHKIWRENINILEWRCTKSANR